MRRNTSLLLALALLTLSTTTYAQDDGYERTPMVREDPVTPTYGLSAPKTNEIDSSSSRKHLRRSWKDYQMGLRAFEAAQQEISITKRVRGYRKAAQGFDAALIRIERLGKRAKKDPALAMETDRLRPHFLRASRASNLELAASYTSRGSYKQAFDAIHGVLKRNPRDAQARRLRRHVQLAQASASRRFR